MAMDLSWCFVVRAQPLPSPASSQTSQLSLSLFHGRIKACALEGCANGQGLGICPISHTSCSGHLLHLFRASVSAGSSMRLLPSSAIPFGEKGGAAYQLVSPQLSPRVDLVASLSLSTMETAPSQGSLTPSICPRNTEV
jgi:hypothetical protein